MSFDMGLPELLMSEPYMVKPYSWSREVTRSEMEYIQVHVNGAIKRGKVLGPLTLQFRINHVSAVDFAHGFRP